MNIKRTPKKLKLGTHYVLWYGVRNKMMCKFIRPTKCGFNFLNLNTNKCVLSRHLYPSKCENHESGDWYWINERLKIEKIG